MSRTVDIQGEARDGSASTSPLSGTAVVAAREGVKCTCR